jgi:redox-sensitive bicupin YhaK (pirin superfamily)
LNEYWLLLLTNYLIFRGIIHQEYHSKDFTKEGGMFEMCQLWVDLPKKQKLTKPEYQGILNEKIPVVNLPLKAAEGSESESLGSARIIAGELGDTKGAAKTFSPIQLWDVSLPVKGSEVDIPFAAEHNCMVFVRRGSVEVLSGEGDTLKASKLGIQDLALLGRDGSDTLKLRILEKNSSVMILGGEPLNQPIAAQGPFVMTTKEELVLAMKDYRSGKFGR